MHQAANALARSHPLGWGGGAVNSFQTQGEDSAYRHAGFCESSAFDMVTVLNFGLPRRVFVPAEELRCGGRGVCWATGWGSWEEAAGSPILAVLCCFGMTQVNLSGLEGDGAAEPLAMTHSGIYVPCK